MKEYIKYIGQTKREFKTTVEDSVGNAYKEVLPKVILAIIKRVHGEGIKTDGTRFKPYSTKGWSYTRAQFADKSAFKPTKGNKMQLPGGYKQLRSIQGLQTQYKDLSYTGELEDSGLTFRTTKNTATIYVNGTRNKRVVGALTRQEGEFYTLNNEEMGMIRDAVAEAIIKQQNAIK